MDNQTGRIYGFIGGRDYNTSQYNRAFQMNRSPGSTIKPILAYAPAIDVGLIGSESRLSDYPKNIVVVLRLTTILIKEVAHSKQHVKH